jgi:hypothetical protein
MTAGQVRRERAGRYRRLLRLQDRLDRAFIADEIGLFDDDEQCEWPKPRLITLGQHGVER